MVKLQTDLIGEAIHYQRSRQRRGTAATKTRSEVRGGGRKPWRQKGTGRARQGSIRAVQWRGGGRAFGSSRHNYDVKLNCKARKKAMALLLADLEQRGCIYTEAMEFEKPSTKQFIQFLKEKGMDGKGLIIYEEGIGENVIRSVRNIPRIKCIHSSCINYHDLIDADWILVAPQDRHVLESKIAIAGATG